MVLTRTRREGSDGTLRSRDTTRLDCLLRCMRQCANGYFIGTSNQYTYSEVKPNFFGTRTLRIQASHIKRSLRYGLTTFPIYKFAPAVPIQPSPQGRTTIRFSAEKASWRGSSSLSQFRTRCLGADLVLVHPNYARLLNLPRHQGLLDVHRDETATAELKREMTHLKILEDLFKAASLDM